MEKASGTGKRRAWLADALLGPERIASRAVGRRNPSAANPTARPAGVFDKGGSVSRMASRCASVTR